MVRICLNVLVGIPASGKTTYCQQLEMLSNRKFKVVHICYDACIKIESKFNDFCDQAGLYKMHRQTLLSSVEEIMLAIKQNDSIKLNVLLSNWNSHFENVLKISSPSGESEDYLFLIDDNNYYSSMRLDWVRVARKLSLGFFETYFNTSLQVALERNKRREHPVSEDVITRMWTRLEKPCAELFRWEQNTIAMQERVDMASIVAQIYHCLENPEKLPESLAPAMPMQQSSVHKLDILLRRAISKYISTAMQSMTKQELNSYVTMLQERKKIMLNQVRSGEQNVPDELLEILVEELL